MARIRRFRARYDYRTHRRTKGPLVAFAGTPAPLRADGYPRTSHGWYPGVLCVTEGLHRGLVDRIWIRERGRWMRYDRID
jgi:hypothetical protein